MKNVLNMEYYWRKAADDIYQIRGLIKEIASPCLPLCRYAVTPLCI